MKLKVTTKIEIECIRPHDKYAEIINADLTNEKIEKTSLEYERYIKDECSLNKGLSEADMDTICNTVKTCLSDGQNFDRAINQVLTKRNLI